MNDELAVLEVDATITRIRAANPGPMTLTGTNTWIIAEPSQASALVIDPGPAMPEHLDAVSSHLRARELQVEVVLLTHGHLDHSEGAKEFASRHDAPLRAADPAWSTSARLTPGEEIRAGGIVLEVLPTPGHTSDSVTFAAADALFTGDTVLGYGTSVVAHPDGRLGDYLRSLETLQQRALDNPMRLLPGHGPVHVEATSVLTDYLVHRRQRLDAVAALLTQRHPDFLAQRAAHGDPAEEQWLAHVVDDVVAEVYRDVPEQVKQAAAHSVRAQLLYLLSENDGTNGRRR